MNNDATFYWPWQSIDELIVLLHLVKAVVRPVVLKVLVDLPVQRIRERFVLSEPGQQGHPIVKFESFFFDTQITIECRDDLNEAGHDEREKGNTGQHDDDAEYFLNIGNWVQISVTDRWQCRDTEVAHGNELVKVIELVSIQVIHR